MPFFGTPIKKLTFDDLDDLVKTKSQENVRLEYKEMPVDMDGYLKKLSSFANTSGGYLVLGMAEGPNNTAREVCGVPAIPSFEAQISAWCAQHLYPPLVPSVSNPIDVPSKGTFAYVIYVEESELAPHFIEGRKGCFVRTNETSHRFEAELANPAELQALFNRRDQARQMREELKARSARRIELRRSLIEKGLVGPLIPTTIAIRPLYPRKPTVPLKDLAETIDRSTVKGGGVLFPLLADVYSQADSLIFPAARHSRLSFVEVTQFGTTSYTEFFQADSIDSVYFDQAERSKARWFRNMAPVLGAIWLGLKFGRNLEVETGFQALLEISLQIKSKAEVAFCLFDDTKVAHSVALLPIDDQITISREVQLEELRKSWVDLGLSLWRELYFSLGWPPALGEIADDAVKAAKRHALDWLKVNASFLST